MKTKAAMISHASDEWTVREIELREEIRPGEVLVRMAAAGLCHTDEHIRQGDLPARFPLAGGHEGSAVALAVGEGVQGIEPGDHLVLTFRPSCGLCAQCVDGKAHLCREIARVQAGDENPRLEDEGVPVNAQSLLATFSEYSIVPAASCVVVPRDIPLDVAALLGCAVPTGYGAAVHAGRVTTGDRVIVVGMGGVGTNALQGAKVAGAATVVAVDVSESKLALAERFGADAAFTSLSEATNFVQAQNAGRKPNVVIVTVPVGAIVTEAVGVVDQSGRVVLAALGDPARFRLELPVNQLVMNDVTVRGTVMGSSTLRHDIPMILNLYRQGKFKLDELISHRFPLEKIRAGYAQLNQGDVIRAVIEYGSDRASGETEVAAASAGI